MLFDHTRIVIRERDYLDIVDLALRVIRTFAGPLVVAWAAGVVPLWLFNSWLLADLAEQDFEAGVPALHMVCMTLLSLYEIPLATAPVTLYLGRALFAQRPRVKEIARDWARSLPQLVIYQGLLRWAYVLWPHLNEVILLERNPMRSRSQWQPSTVQRSRGLHRDQGGEILARTMSAGVLSAGVFLSLWLSMLILSLLVLAEWEPGNMVCTWMYPLAMWIVIGLFAVVRFLSYLDFRIRREGWEVELCMRAEAARLNKGLT